MKLDTDVYQQWLDKSAHSPCLAVSAISAICMYIFTGCLSEGPIASDDANHHHHYNHRVIKTKDGVIKQINYLHTSKLYKDCPYIPLYENISSHAFQHNVSNIQDSQLRVVVSYFIVTLWDILFIWLAGNNSDAWLWLIPSTSFYCCHIILDILMLGGIIISRASWIFQGPLLLTWFNFNPSMDK